MIYLDHAATSYPKPPGVYAEVMRALLQYGGSPGRGTHPLALAAAEQVFACREALASFLGVGAPERILFTHNATDALNLAIKGFLQPGAHVLISELEHNAVRRPLCRLQAERGVRFDSFPVLGKSTAQLLAGIAARLTPETVAVICTHASNVCSVTLPAREIGAFCHAHGLRFILDAAQSAGHLDINLQDMQIDALAAPAHKGLCGIQGAGILALGEGFLPTPLLEGGSGTDSLSKEMPPLPPERYEAGTLATPAIAAMLRGVEFLRERGLESIHAHECALFLALRERLLEIPSLQIYAPEYPGAVLLFNSARYPCSELAHLLGTRGICVRAGYHCAPMAHAALGTPEGGAVRVSFGHANTLAELDTLYFTLRELHA